MKVATCTRRGHLIIAVIRAGNIELFDSSRNCSLEQKIAGCYEMLAFCSRTTKLVALDHDHHADIFACDFHQRWCRVSRTEVHSIMLKSMITFSYPFVSFLFEGSIIVWNAVTSQTNSYLREVCCHQSPHASHNHFFKHAKLSFSGSFLVAIEIHQTDNHGPSFQRMHLVRLEHENLHYVDSGYSFLDCSDGRIDGVGVACVNSLMTHCESAVVDLGSAELSMIDWKPSLTASRGETLFTADDLGVVQFWCVAVCEAASTVNLITEETEDLQVILMHEIHLYDFVSLPQKLFHVCWMLHDSASTLNATIGFDLTFGEPDLRSEQGFNGAESLPYNMDYYTNSGNSNSRHSSDLWFAVLCPHLENNSVFATHLISIPVIHQAGLSQTPRVNGVCPKICLGIQSVETPCQWTNCVHFNVLGKFQNSIDGPPSIDICVAFREDSLSGESLEFNSSNRYLVRYVAAKSNPRVSGLVRFPQLAFEAVFESGETKLGKKLQNQEISENI